jgi:predicted RecB family nuclease
MNCPFAYYLAKVLCVNIEIPYPMERGSKIHKICEKTLKKEISFDEKDDVQRSILKMLLYISKKESIKKIEIEDKIHIKLLKGFIDFWVETDKNIIVLDYKTGKMHPIEEYKYELYFYAMLYNLKYKKYPTILGIYFIDHEKLSTYLFDINEYNITLNTINEVIKKIERDIKNKKFKKNTNNCNYCLYKQHCLKTV